MIDNPKYYHDDDPEDNDEPGKSFTDRVRHGIGELETDIKNTVNKAKTEVKNAID